VRIGDRTENATLLREPKTAGPALVYESASQCG
jgi:hypothetical protein